jgi:hypothetical protein
MDLNAVHINPVAPDPGASGRYASDGERRRSGGEDRSNRKRLAADSLELSESGRRYGRIHTVSQDVDFARKALDRLSAPDPQRVIQLTDRIASRFYGSSVVREQVAARMVPYGSSLGPRVTRVPHGATGPAGSRIRRP